MPRVLTMVAALSRARGRYLTRWVRNSRTLMSSSGETCFSKPSGINDVGVAGHALFLEDGLAGHRVTRFLDQRQELLDDFLAIGAGQAAALLQELAGDESELLVGVIGQVLLLIEGQIREDRLASLHPCK